MTSCLPGGGEGGAQMRIFISGGCKNGKSTLAQTLAVRQRTPGKSLYYVATMRPADSEDDARVARHIAERAGMGFTTVEQPENLGALLERCDAGGSFLLDSLTALLSNEMFLPGAAQPDFTASARIAQALDSLLAQTDNIVVVSDYIYSDAAFYDETVEAYRKGLARLDKACAAACDTVLEVCAATVTVHKGKMPEQ